MTLLTSIMDQHEPGELKVHLLYSDITEESLAKIETYLKESNHDFQAYDCQEYFDYLADASITRHYSLDMYSWLFAPFLLDEGIDRALYLDPDIICLNRMDGIYYQDFEEHAFVATAYDYKNKLIQPINNIRLGAFDSENYFNTGVVLLNLPRIRQLTDPEKIVETIYKKDKVLYLPDQDIFHAMFEKETKKVSWKKYNIDPRAYEVLNLLLPKQYSKEWLEDKVVFIHYCGKHKPFNEGPDYRYQLGRYYFDYEAMRDENLDLPEYVEWLSKQNEIVLK